MDSQGPRSGFLLVGPIEHRLCSRCEISRGETFEIKSPEMPGNTSIFNNHHEVAYSFASILIFLMKKIIGGALAQPATPLRDPLQYFWDHNTMLTRALNCGDVTNWDSQLATYWQIMKLNTNNLYVFQVIVYLGHFWNVHSDQGAIFTFFGLFE